MIEITDWIVAAGTAVMALVAIIAIFQDKIRAWLTHPKLEISIRAAPPDCHKTVLVRRDSEGAHSVDCYYFRFRVTNIGNHKAEQVEAFAAELLKQQADGTFRLVDSFLPMNLVWSHYGEVFIPAISPGMYRHCDLAHVLHPEQRHQLEAENNSWPNVSTDRTILSFDTIVRPYTLTSLVPPGTYRLILLIAAANATPLKEILEIRLTGDWYDDEYAMLSEGVGIRML